MATELVCSYYGPKRCPDPNGIDAPPPAPADGSTPNRPYVFWSTLT